MAKVLAILRDPGLSLLAKWSAILIALIQYFYKQRHHTKVQFDIEINGIKLNVSKIMQAKFLLQNREKVGKFKTMVNDNCKQMSDVLTEHDFKPVIDKNMNNFYDEFEAVNLKTYEDVT